MDQHRMIGPKAGFVMAAVLIAGSGRAAESHKPPAADVPSGKYYKNIQVFKDLPSTQLMSAMKFMASALGTRCEHCHVTSETGNWPMEKDDKPAKKRAREMVAMMRSINASNFNGKMLVTCATCHHGQIKPAASPPLQTEGTVAPAASSSSALPSVDSVFNKYISASGGRERLENITTRSLRAAASSGGESVPFQVTQKAPNKYLVTSTFKDGEKLSRAYDGKVGWDRGTDEGGEMGEDELVPFRRRALFSLPLSLQGEFSTLTVTGRETVGGRDAYVLSGRAKDGMRETLDFDAQNGLLARRTTLIDTALGPVPDESNFQDYRDIGGERLPLTVVRVGPNFRETQTYTDVRQNIPVDDAVFAKPKMP
jgi:hypothetical protein